MPDVKYKCARLTKIKRSFIFTLLNLIIKVLYKALHDEISSLRAAQCNLQEVRDRQGDKFSQGMGQDVDIVFSSDYFLQGISHGSNNCNQRITGYCGIHIVNIKLFEV